MRSSAPSSQFRGIHSTACSGSIRSPTDTCAIPGLVSCAFVNAILGRTLVSMKNDEKLRHYTHTHTHMQTHFIYIYKGNVKVKVSLEQATKAQRGSRCIALLFLQSRR